MELVVFVLRSVNQHTICWRREEDRAYRPFVSARVPARMRLAIIVHHSSRAIFIVVRASLAEGRCFQSSFRHSWMSPSRRGGTASPDIAAGL